MFPVVTVYGKEELTDHFREIVKKLCDAGLPVVACWASTAFDYPVFGLSDDVYELCKAYRVVDSAMLYIKEFRGSSIVMIELRDAEFENDALHDAYMSIVNIARNNADILLTVGDYGAEGVNIEHATQTAFEVISGVVGDGV